jgi:hypothetical protein
VMRQAAGGCIAVFAERALDGGAAVDAGIEMLGSDELGHVPL